MSSVLSYAPSPVSPPYSRLVDEPTNAARQLLPIPGTSGPAEFTKSDAHSASGALLQLAVALDKITFETADNPPPEGSAGLTLFNHAERGYAIDGFLTMQYANLSAIDHIRCFVTLVRTSTGRSTGLATVTRGALESLARTWHLLARRSEQDFIYRVISLLRSDLRYSEILQEPIRTRDGDPVDPATKRAFYASELNRLGLPAAAKTDLARMVAAMLDAEMATGEGRARYSALSSIAHAHRTGINTFITTSSDGQVSGLAAPRPVVMDMVGQLVAGTYGTARAFVTFYGDQTRHGELLETAMQRALRSLEPVIESIWPASLQEG